MSQIRQLATLRITHEAAISCITSKLAAIGLVVSPSFNLQVARSAHDSCTCPHHGTTQCDCQIVVLLVYGGQPEPVTLVVHSQDGFTYLSMTAEGNTDVEDSLVGKISRTLGSQELNII